MGAYPDIEKPHKYNDAAVFWFRGVEGLFFLGLVPDGGPTNLQDRCICAELVAEGWARSVEYFVTSCSKVLSSIVFYEKSRIRISLKNALFYL